LLVQTHRARARCQVVVSRPLRRSPPQESGPRRRETKPGSGDTRRVEAASARGL